MTLYERGWYTAAARRLVYTDSEANHAAHLQAYRRAVSEFERQLSADGYVVLKFFVHISKDVQKKRLKGLHDNPDTAVARERRRARHCKRLRRDLRALR